MLELRLAVLEGRVQVGDSKIRSLSDILILIIGVRALIKGNRLNWRAKVSFLIFEASGPLPCHQPIDVQILISTGCTLSI